MIKNIIFDFGGVILKHKSTLMEEKLGIKGIIFKNLEDLKEKLLKQILT
ncbi:hypothetical protein HY383_04150 [Candidatus Daviesbacteria bacterium]|nr:hypothetical protein [Candidatus Daviesbacteria bacterium]